MSALPLPTHPPTHLPKPALLVELPVLRLVYRYDYFCQLLTHLFSDTTVESILSEKRATLEIFSDALAFYTNAVLISFAVFKTSVVSHPSEVPDSLTKWKRPLWCRGKVEVMIKLIFYGWKTIDLVYHAEFLYGAYILAEGKS